MPFLPRCQDLYRGMDLVLVLGLCEVIMKKHELSKQGKVQMFVEEMLKTNPKTHTNYEEWIADVEHYRNKIMDIFEEERVEIRIPKEVSKSAYLIALEESLKLQAHYARLLNDYDGGKRRIFKSVSEWLERLQDMRNTLRIM